MNESLQKSLFDLTVELWCVCSKEGFFIEFSPEWVTLLGYSHEEITQTPFGSFLHPDDVAATNAVFEGQQRGREVRQFENRFRHRDGTVSYLLWRGSIGEDGTVYGVARDITKQKNSDIEARMRAKNLAEQVAELKRVNAEVNLINEMADLLQSCLTLAEATAVFAVYSERLFPGTSGCLATLSPSKTALEISYSWGTRQEEALFHPDDCWAMRRGQTHGVGPDGRGVYCNHLRPNIPSLCVPLISGGEGLGILTIQQQCLVDITSIATSVSGRIASALANFRLRDTLKSQSVKDPLTGLYNRRLLEESLAWEFLRSERRHRPLSIVALDIDHFKSLNDAHGHDAGNTALKAVADALRASIRKGDTACRSGGEEFTVVLTETSAEDARIVAEKILNSVRALKLVDVGVLLPRITISAGVATYPDHVSTLDQLQRAADAALYTAKHSGRDNVMISTATPTQRKE